MMDYIVSLNVKHISSAQYEEGNISITTELDKSGDESIIGRTGTVMGVKEASRREGKGKKGRRRFSNIIDLISILLASRMNSSISFIS